MSILYGSIEYFEKQIEIYLAIYKYEDINIIWSSLEKEILNDSLVEDELIRQKFLKNLHYAADQYQEKHRSLFK